MSSAVPSPPSPSLRDVTAILVSPPLLGLFVLALIVITLSSRSAADPWKKQETRQKEQEGGDVVNLRALHALAFAVVASGGLMAMWWFPNALVYISLVSFGLCAWMGLKRALEALSRRAGAPFTGGWAEGLASAAVVGWWATVRNSSDAWLLQDFLGGFVIALMLRVLKLPNVKVASILLLTAFIYDIFWVFVSPHFTSNGKSVMEHAATGSGVTVDEQVPMLFRIPIRGAEGQGRGWTMLGFGDLILPGMFLTLLREVDVRMRGYISDLQKRSSYSQDEEVYSPRFLKEERVPLWEVIVRPSEWSYHVVGTIGYAVGLEITFAIMLLTRVGQPALLYLVPAILVPVVLLALRRREFGIVWRGTFWEDGSDDGYVSVPQEEAEMDRSV